MNLKTVSRTINKDNCTVTDLHTDTPPDGRAVDLRVARVVVERTWANANDADVYYVTGDGRVTHYRPTASVVLTAYPEDRLLTDEELAALPYEPEEAVGHFEVPRAMVFTFAVPEYCEDCELYRDVETGECGCVDVTDY